MMKKQILAAVAIALLIGACASHAPAPTTRHTTPDRLPGDSTVYGLACDGCTDTLLIMLTDVTANPDTFNILMATSQRRVFGRPRVGDRVALLRNAEDSLTADLVVNLERLNETWCFQVTPKLRERAGVTDEMQKQMMTRMPDSVKQRLLAPREFGYQLKGEHAVRTIGLMEANADKNLPIDYERPPHYNEWYILNGHLLFSEVRRDSLGNRTVLHADTADLVRLRRDTLELSFSGVTRQFYRKTN